MPGKYDKVIPTLEKLPSDLKEGGVDYQDKIVAASLEIETREPAALARGWKAIRAEEDRNELEAKAMRLKRRAYEFLMEKVFEDHGLQTLALTEGGSVAHQPEPKAVVYNKDEYRTWCVEQGLAPLMTMPWQTTNRDAKEALLNDRPLPPGVKVFNVPKFVLRK